MPALGLVRRLRQQTRDDIDFTCVFSMPRRNGPSTACAAAPPALPLRVIAGDVLRQSGLGNEETDRCRRFVHGKRDTPTRPESPRQQIDVALIAVAGILFLPGHFLHDAQVDQLIHCRAGRGETRGHNLPCALDVLRTGANPIEKPPSAPFGRGRSSSFFRLLYRKGYSTSSAFRDPFKSEIRNRTRVPQSFSAGRTRPRGHRHAGRACRVQPAHGSAA